MTTKELNVELWDAIAKADTDQVRKLIAKGADVDAIGDRNAPLELEKKTPLWACVSLAGHTRLLSQLGTLNKRQLAKSQNDFAKKRQRHLKMIELLIRAGADMEKYCYGSTPLRIACITNDLEVAEILLANGANPNAEIYSPMSKAAKKAENKLQPSYYGTILQEIVSKGFQGAIAALIKAGADPNRIDEEGRTAFDIAEHKGGGTITKLLARNRRPPGKTSEVLVRPRHGRVSGE